MELTRHFTASLYLVSDGAVALHDHRRLDMWLPPGGHVDRGELPHRTAVRETREETGLEPDLVTERESIGSETVESLPRPRHVQLADVNRHDGTVSHQHVDLVYYGHTSSREIDPADGEVSAEAWRWFDSHGLRDADFLEPDTVEIGQRAIETVDVRGDS
jgi:8-oxo-dGTP pyrophosphatase MutT (NUDIX family)